MSRWGVLKQLVRHRPRGWRDYLLNYVSEKQKAGRAYGRPVHILVEPTNYCNLGCEVCETGAGDLGRAQGFMTLENFNRILDKIPSLNSMLFYFMGEPFLNRAAYDMIAAARARGIWVETCTNGDLVDPERLVACDLNLVSFQIGGLVQETHKVYRVNSLLPRVIERMKAVRRLRDERGLVHPEINLGFIVMRHNEHEVPDVPAFAREVGADRFEIVKPCVRTIEQGRKFLTQADEYWIYDRRKFEEGELIPLDKPKNWCGIIYHSMGINWNGDVVSCCRDPRGKYVLGNILKQPLNEIWNGPKFRELRRMVATRQAEMDLCRLCSGYWRPEIKSRDENAPQLSPTP
ncbi:SPASM domain-containing protein [bacterium]|nr:SPASM domain-containing protein [bacterium]